MRAFVQIDEGYQRAVGDWLQLNEPFRDQMRRLADTIREAGFRPGLWLAPFVAAAKSELAKIHPEYILRDEHGRRLFAGFNPWWPGKYYVGLDATNPRFEEYLRRVIRTMVGEWGFEYLKCDFLFGGCLRGGTHHNLYLSRAEVLRYGMDVIRAEADAHAKNPVVIAGCGMPLVPGIGTVDVMRVGPDTGGFWIERRGQLLRTGSNIGVRNSIRNSLVRAPMHRSLWHNDPDCLMLRRNGTKLSAAQRRTQINAIVLTGGVLLFSDDFAALDAGVLAEIRTIQGVIDECFTGRLIPWDVMERELPRIVVNTAGYVGVFNMERRALEGVDVPLGAIGAQAAAVAAAWGHAWRAPRALREVWSGEVVDVPEAGGAAETAGVAGMPAMDRMVRVGPLAPYESRLYRFEW